MPVDGEQQGAEHDFVIAVKLMAYGRYQVAATNTTDDAILAQEAEADEVIAWSVQAKTARWTGGFVEAAEFARAASR